MNALQVATDEPSSASDAKFTEDVMIWQAPSTAEHAVKKMLLSAGVAEVGGSRPTDPGNEVFAQVQSSLEDSRKKDMLDLVPHARERRPPMGAIHSNHLLPGRIVNVWILSIA
jgi:hypothetical protein